jgi:hypothetical protein
MQRVLMVFVNDKKFAKLLQQHPTCSPIINAHFQHLELIKTTFERGQLMEHLHQLPHTINKQQLSSSTMEQNKS